MDLQDERGWLEMPPRHWTLERPGVEPGCCGEWGGVFEPYPGAGFFAWRIFGDRKVVVEMEGGFLTLEAAKAWVETHATREGQP